MNADGEWGAAAIGAPSSGRLWPVLILMLIGMNASIVGATVYFALSDGSVATEPEYYAKALRFEETIRQRERSAELGWIARPTVRWLDNGRAARLVVTLSDREGRAINGARVTAVAFANVRSGERQPLNLGPTDLGAGEYEAPIRIDRPGLWHIRIGAEHEGSSFVRETDLLVPDPAR
ncbi:MAG: FixH family protein [Phycisphaerae bacterium]|nr:FixH family protein [Phycisphaerae bacterium]